MYNIYIYIYIFIVCDNEITDTSYTICGDKFLAFLHFSAIIGKLGSNHI